MFTIAGAHGPKQETLQLTVICYGAQWGYDEQPPAAGSYELKEIYEFKTSCAAPECTVQVPVARRRHIDLCVYTAVSADGEVYQSAAPASFTQALRGCLYLTAKSADTTGSDTTGKDTTGKDTAGKNAPDCQVNIQMKDHQWYHPDHLAAMFNKYARDLEDHYQVRFLLALLATLLVELLALFVMARLVFLMQEPGGLRLLFTGAVASALTLPYVWYVVFSSHGASPVTPLTLAGAEVGVVLIEALLYHRILKTSALRALIISVVANGASLVAGFLVGL